MRPDFILTNIDGELPDTVNVTQLHNDKCIPNYHIRKFGDGKTTLTDLSKEYQFFTHSILFVYGNWLVDPVQDYINQFDQGCAPFQIQFDQVIIRGMPDLDWASRLLACPHEQWPGLHCFLQQVKGVDRIKRRFYRTFTQSVPLSDHLLLYSKNLLRLIDIISVGIDGNDKAVSLMPDRGMLRVKKHKPDKETIELAERVFKDDYDELFKPPEMKKDG